MLQFACIWLQASAAGLGVNLPDAEAYASAAGFDFGAPARGVLEGPRPLVRGGSLSRGFALPVQGPGVLNIHLFAWTLMVCMR